MKSAITAIGIANPPYLGAQKDVVEFMAEALELTAHEKKIVKKLYNGTGIDYRSTVLADFKKKLGEFSFFPNERKNPFPSTAQRMQVYQQTALPLALQAIQNCLSLLPNFDLQEITHLITVSCTGMYAPGIDIEIIHELGLKTAMQRTAINFMGCYGAFNGIKVANAICQANPEAKVLVVSVELCTLHFQKNKSMENLISSAIFSDGAGAVLIEANPVRKKYFSLDNFYCDLVVSGSKEMAWYVGDQGFDMVLSAYVPQCVEGGIAELTKRLLVQSKINFADIDYFAIHPGGVKILQACERALNITPEQNNFSYEVLRQHGNMSSATVLFVLKAIWDEVTTADTDKRIFSCSFGPGLTLESMLLTVGCSFK